MGPASTWDVFCSSFKPIQAARITFARLAGDLWEMVFFSRHSGTRNVRHVEGAEAFEDKLKLGNCKYHLSESRDHASQVG